MLRDDPRYRATAAREFDAVTPENAMKWAVVHRAPDRWCLADADRIVAFAEANGMRPRGHALVWHEQLPPWLDGRLTAGRLHAALAAHVDGLVGRYRGRVPVWDVVNEAVGPGGRLRRSVFERRLGPGYVAEAFALAHAADPGARLFYNDYGAETPGRKGDAVHELLAGLRARGVPVHGVGLQMHLDAARPPRLAGLADQVARLAALGLAVEITEMDVRVAALGGSPAARLATQRAVYRDVLAACLAAPGVAAVTFWGVADRHSWVHARWGPDAPLLFDDAYAPKPAYLGVEEAMEEAFRTPRAG